MASLEQGKGSKKPRGSSLPGAKSKPVAAVSRRVAKPPSRAVSAEERYAMVAQAAYLRASQRGFAPGNELDDWLAAEAEIEMRLAAR